MGDAHLLTTIGIEMPSDFAVDPYEATHRRACILLQGPDPLWWDYGGAWNAVAYRFVALAYHDRCFTEAVRSPTSPEVRSIQERELFAFFVTGLSVLESFTYATHTIAAKLHPTEFPMNTERERHGVRLNATTIRRFQEAFAGEALPQRLAAIAASTEIKEWRHIRNVLAHRAQPGRQIHLSAGTRSIPRADEWQVAGFTISIDAATTSSRRSWVVRSLRGLLEAADTFTAKHIEETDQ